MERPVRTSHTYASTTGLLSWSEPPPPSDRSPASSATSASGGSFKSGKRDEERRSIQENNIQKETMKMERPVRTSHTSTSCLLTWSEVPPPSDRSPPPSAPSASRGSFKPDKREEESKSLQKKSNLQQESKKMEKMERPVRTSHNSTSGLLTWSNAPPPSDLSPVPSATSASRGSFKPADRISPVMFGAPLSKKEAEELNKRKSCSDSKLKEMTGSGIFAGKNGIHESELDSVSPNIRTSVKINQQAVGGISQISFATQETPSPKKPTSLTEVAKQRELSGTLEIQEAQIKTLKEVSQAKIKELSGNDIFGPPSEMPARTMAARNHDLKGNVDFTHPKPRTLHTSVKVSHPAGGPSNIKFNEEIVVKPFRKINDQKYQELTGSGIFNEAVPVKSPPERTLSEAKLREMSGIFKEAAPIKSSPERMLSEAKLREISGSNIFSNGPSQAEGPPSRDYFGGTRQPPGGKSTITLI